MMTYPRKRSQGAFARYSSQLLICSAHLSAYYSLHRTAIIAEYLAHGYIIGDNIIAKAVDYDRKLSHDF